METKESNNDMLYKDIVIKTKGDYYYFEVNEKEFNTATITFARYIIDFQKEGVRDVN